MAGICRYVLWILVIFPVLCLYPQASLASPGFLFLNDTYDLVAKHFGISKFPLVTQLSRNVSTQCMDKLINLAFNPKEIFLYWDATGKPSSGLLTDLPAPRWLGSYRECTKMIDGAHYCLSVLYIHANISAFGFRTTEVPIIWGLCAPKECTEEDITEGLSETFSVIKWMLGFKGSVSVSSVNCNKKSEYTTGVIITLTLCSFIASLCLVGTIIDAFLSFRKSQSSPANNSDRSVLARDGFTATDDDEVPHAPRSPGSDNQETTSLINISPITPLVSRSLKQNMVIRLFLCFSLIENTKRIFDTQLPPFAITSISGMRVLSMFWIILGHTFFLYSKAIGNVVYVRENVGRRFNFMAIWNAHFSVDTFFFLSGMLVAFVTLRKMENSQGRLSLFKFYFHRYWRLTPTYMFVLVFYAKITGFLADGPAWFIQQSNKHCDKYWWTNLLYINNFYPPKFDNQCMGWGWYLANDMQFYIIAPLILFAAYRFRLRGMLAAVGFFISASLVTNAVIAAHYDIKATAMTPQPPGVDEQSLVYDKPYCRIVPYLVGMALGYVLLYTKGRQNSKTYLLKATGWCFAIILALSVVYGPHTAVKKVDPEPFTRAENIMYMTFARFAWSLALAWVIFACHRGLGGLVDKILSAWFWIPLSRMTYSAYLVHMIVLTVVVGSSEVLISYSDILISVLFAGVLTISYSVAFIVCVCVETPLMRLENLALY